MSAGPQPAPSTDAELRQLLDAVAKLGKPTVLLLVPRQLKPGASGTVRLYGKHGPSSSEDHPVTRVDKLHVHATFRIRDLETYLRARAKTCYAIGCEDACHIDHLMCTRHWAMVPARYQVGVYKAKSRACLSDPKVLRIWLVAAERAICWVAVREGRMTAAESDRRIRDVEPSPALACAPGRGPYALLDAALAERGA